MVQSEPVTVIPPLVPSNGSSWTSVSAAKLYCCQSDPLGIIQQATEACPTDELAGGFTEVVTRSPLNNEIVRG